MPNSVLRFLDDDHVLRVAQYALAGPRRVSDAWLKAFFSPEAIDPQQVFAMGHGLRDEDGVALASTAHHEAPDAVSNAQILIFRRGVIDARLVNCYPKLRLIQRLGERTDGIDLALTRQRGISVSCIPRQSLANTGEHVILLMLACARQLIQADRMVRNGGWDPALVQAQDNVAYNWAGLRNLSGLHGKVLGILGMGEVGTGVAKLASAMGMKVIFNNRTQPPEGKSTAGNAIWVPRPVVLADADFLSVHVTAEASNHKLMNLEAFKAMKPSAFFINTSRGALVDEDALYTALSQGLIAGAALDVHAQEPRPPGHPLGQLPNVIMTPHCAGGSRTGILQELSQIFDNCRAVLAGCSPLHGLC